jgi:outer membrane protein assembly factor BamB
MKYRKWSVLGILWLTSVACGQSADWHRFRGPNGTGVSNATTVPVTWTDDDYNWKVRLPGTGHASPVVWRDRIYLTCADQETAGRCVLCLNTADGSTVWQRDYPLKTYRQHRDNGYATASPAVDEHGVVVTWTTPKEIVLLALAHDGGQRWRRDLGPFVGPHGTGTSPIIVDGLVILANEQEDYKLLARLMGRGEVEGPAGESALIAVDRKTGETRWKVPRKTTLASYSTPCVRRCNGGSAELIFTGTSHGITAVDVATGKINWQLEDVFEDRCVGSPVTAAGLVIAGYGHGTVGNLCLAARPGSRSGGREPSVAYEIRQSVPLVPSPLVRGDRLYLWTDRGIVSCLDVSSGRLIWRERVGGNFYGSPICVADRLYCISKEGEVVVLAAGDEFKVLARGALGEPSYSTPAVSGGVMYLRTSSHLYSLGGG